MTRIFAGSAQYPTQTPGPVVTIGNFDGFHVGHQHLISQLRQRCDELNSPSCVYTFEPPPRVLLSADRRFPRIMPWDQKLRLLADAGVDHIVIERFTRAFSQHPPQWFLREILRRRLRARALVVGHDFRFGRARAGTVELLRDEAPDIDVQQVSPETLNGVVVSSTAIRKLVAAGDVVQAACLLGRPHQVVGTVVAGERRGRKIGYPTANVESDAELLPSDGVYAVKCRISGEDQWRSAVANLGRRPTFDGRKFLIEVHILDFSGDIYGEEIAVSFVDRIRDERRFKDGEALAQQLREDVVTACDRLS